MVNATRTISNKFIFPLLNNYTNPKTSLEVSLGYRIHSPLNWVLKHKQETKLWMMSFMEGLKEI